MPVKELSRYAQRAKINLAEQCSFNSDDFDNISTFVDNIKNYPLTKKEKEKLAKAAPYDILFVCRENQGRSQIVEWLMKVVAGILGINADIRSAGYQASPEKYEENRPNPYVISMMSEYGVPLNKARVKQLVQADVHDNTILVCLDDPSKLEPWVFNARLVLAIPFNDPAPKDTIKPDAKKLFSSLEEGANLAMQMTFKLAESIIGSDFNIFEKYFHKKIIKKPSTKIS